MLSPAVEQLINLALNEDLAYGDITSEPLFTRGQQSQADIAVRQSAVVSGLTVAQAVFHRVDPNLKVTLKSEDGAAVTPGTAILSVSGETRSMLKAERLALNFLQHLCGIATMTYQYVGAISGTRARITHTRKTTPGLRSLEIQAVIHGGGSPHRNSLSQAVMLKDNHIQAAGGIRGAVERIRHTLGHTTLIEVECDTLDQVAEAVEAGAHVILLDNMDLKTLEAAVKAVNFRAVTEASGGVTLNSVLDIARTGVAVISTSQITLGAPPVDIGLDFL